jgi:ectoine hydroxylase-related dioxygenase (phytanoyl-CoA dioxygenase family)
VKDAFQEHGYVVSKAILSEEQLAAAREEAARLAEAASGRGGVRNVLQRSPYFRELAGGLLRELACEYAGAGAQAVKATLFDKTARANWKVPWHQDLTIAVRRRLETPGFGPWSIKDGVPHVQPPVPVLEALVALRLHLDDTPEENGALRVVVASHRLGRIPEARIAAVRENGLERVAAVPAGGVMVMSPLLLHASSASSRPEHRRVLHVEYSSLVLPAGLEWAA